MSAAESQNEFDGGDGRAPARHIDLSTAELDRLARTWIDLQQIRKALAQRELPDEIVAEFDRLEKRVSTLLTDALRRHPLWPWLKQFPGLGGAHVALLIGRIGDPRRFPGQRCTEGHYLPPLYAVGAPCPIAASRRENEQLNGDGLDAARADERSTVTEIHRVCPGVMLPPRTTTGVRSLWHWAGLHVLDDGRAPRKRKGVQGDWEPRVRASVMQPGGIAEQIVRWGVRTADDGTKIALHKYAQIYLDTKARLTLRVADAPPESERVCGDAKPLRTAETLNENDRGGGRPLRLHEADRIARKVAAKAFLADLLTEWKRLIEETPE